MVLVRCVLQLLLLSMLVELVLAIEEGVVLRGDHVGCVGGLRAEGGVRLQVQMLSRLLTFLHRVVGY